MRLSKTSWLLLAVGIVVIMLGSLGMAYREQVDSQQQLEQDLSLAEMKLSLFSFGNLYAQQEELEGRLAEAKINLKSAKAKLYRPTTSIAASSILYNVASDCKVEILEVSSPGLGGGNMEGVTCSVLTFTAKVEGDLPDLLKFASDLTSKFPTGLIQSVQIDIPKAAENEETEEDDAAADEDEDEAKPVADVQVIIYSYAGE
jgi:hypothetical protein